MQKFSKLRWAAFLVLLVWPAWIPCPESAASDDAAYRLGVGDMVKISILAGGEEQVAKEMVVGDTGDVTVPFIGKLTAAGLTINELEKQIVPPLARDFFVEPQVHLQIIEYHSLQFFISGAVKEPGVFSLDFIPTIMDLIAKAGGVTQERGNLAYVLRGMKAPIIMAQDKTLENLDAEVPTQSIAGTKPIIVDLKRLLDEGDMTENIRLATGDTIYIPPGTKLDQAATKIYVQGKVKTPGVFEYQPGMTALAACIMAGGFDKFSAPNRARVIRRTSTERTIITINLKKVQTGDEPDLPLQPGDRIHIPESWL
ncbi:polysaccharide export protein [Desulfobacter hydrogenophilus]|uniref:Polysaccharide export protein n=1 Tax=Desulfobacter hydrogenophilus TaxID=2291 RepID=A0A328F6D1_9BACT|nr:SLBB domain-containing protein [Desulfobacter hydrogenophilus]NDY74581.1 polysaccharide export protein [Desulfobacter hydrogenophilus]QBH14119.1 polysaccharide export protein [Desulfobacter hydrogenophilus]RAM00071.1 polysaccharide export protein [Desulfobacter hydrogenophilus]